MSRPPVSVVMPFAGDAAAAAAAADTLRSLNLRSGDELILVDNDGAVPALDGITVVPAAFERSPAHARNAGARRARGDWILFLDADCQVQPTLLDDYFSLPVDEGVGALAGGVVPAAGAATLAGRYGAARNFLSQEAHLAHPYLPRAVAANLLVRAEAFRALGGFLEGVSAAEDTDFSWRLQRAGWGLELRPGAGVSHTYRASVRELRRQWRRYAAGRAWLGRRYAGFAPEPALRRALRRLPRLRHASGRTAPSRDASRLERGRLLGLDAVLALEELAGFALSNRPPTSGLEQPARVILVAERFPTRADPLVDFARTLDGAQVEAAARPELVEPALGHGLRINYREDDGSASRLLAALWLIMRHPLRSARDVLSQAGGAGAPGPSLVSLAPAVARIERQAAVRVHALGGDQVRLTAARLAALAGRPLDGEQ